MRRHALTEEHWRRLQKVLPEQKTGPASTLGDRQFIEAVLFRAKTGMPWRDLPERFGPWKSVYNRFNNWARRGHWATIFKELQLEIDDVGSIVDGSVVRAHQDASGGKGDHQQCSGPLSRRLFDQATRRRRHEIEADPPRDHARPKARDDRGRRATRPCSRQGAHRRYRLRLEPLPTRRARQGHAAGHPRQARAPQETQTRQKALSAALPRRGLLPQLEALPGHRDPLREDGTKLPRPRTGRLRLAMARELGTPPRRGPIPRMRVDGVVRGLYHLTS